MGAIDNLKSNSDKVAYTSYFNTDKIIVANSETTSSDTYPNIPNDLMPIGVYSLDGGTTWQDCGQYSLPGGLTIEPSAAVDVLFRTSAGNGVFILNSSHQIKYVGLGLSTVDYPVSYIETGKSSINTQNNYMKIALEGSFTKSAGAGLTTQTIAHNLGYVPIANVWIKDSNFSSPAAIRRPISSYGNSGTISEGVRLDSTNIYISTNNATDTTVYYRIYYEQ